MLSTVQTLPGVGVTKSCSNGVRFDLECLLQELTLALIGITGEVFIDANNQDPSCTEVATPDVCTLSVSPDIALSDDVNREELNQLLKLGFHFKAVRQFIQQEQQPLDGRKSMYRCALCCGLNEVLCLFEDEVVLLQEQLLRHGLQRGLPGITYQLADFQRLLTHLHHLVFELRRRSSSLTASAATQHTAGRSTNSSSAAAGGGTAGDTRSSSDPGCEGVTPEGLVLLPHTCGVRLLHWLHDQRAHGEPLLQTCTQRLMWHVHQVLFNQLTMWMVHGLLVDSGNEFFINIHPEAAGGSSSSSSSKRSERAASAADTGVVRDTSKGCQSCDCMDVAVMTEKDTYRDFHAAFYVNNLQRPPGITTHTAASVEFVGRAVRLLKSAPAAAKLKEMQDTCGSYNLQQQQQDVLGQGSPCVMPQPLLPYGDAMAYAAALRMLQQQDEYSPAALERTVEAIRADVASRLWHLVVVESSLISHLTSLKDYMLLAKGDLYQSFLTDAAALLALPPPQVSARDLAVPWQSAASKSTAAYDPHFKSFRLTIDASLATQQKQEMERRVAKAAEEVARGRPTAEAQLKAVELVKSDPPQAVDCLLLEAQLPWPLGVLITPHHLAGYNKLFGLLIKVKRVQLHLETAWQELGRLCGRKGGSTCPRDIGQLLQLRQHMGHLITNLQLYLQLDVIETNFDWLLQQVAAAQDFAEVAQAHENFMRALKTQSLLYSARLAELMQDVCSLSRQLCALVKGAREDGIDLEAVQDVREAFDVVVKDLSWSMRSRWLQQVERAPYLNQLHERLDYNGFLSKRNPLELHSQQHKAGPPRSAGVVRPLPTSGRV